MPLVHNCEVPILVVESTSKFTSDKFESAKDKVKEVAEDAKDAVKGAIEGVKNMVKKDDK